MANITLSLPDELKKEMDKHAEISWSAVMKTIIEDRLERLQEMERILSKSLLTEKDVRELVEKVNESTRKHVGALYDETGRRR